MNHFKFSFSKNKIQLIKLPLIIIGIINLFIIFPSYAQSNQKTTLDSLLKVIKNDISIKDKVNTYNLIANEYIPNDSLEIIKYTEQAINLAKKNNYYEGIVSAYYLRGGFYRKVRNIELAKKNYEQALSIAVENHFEEQQGDIFYQMAGILKRETKHEQAIESYKNAIQKFQKIDNKLKMGDANYQLGVLYFGKGMYDETIKTWEEALQNKKIINDKLGIATVYNAFGVLYDRLNQYDKVLFFYQKSLEIKKEIGDLKGMAKTYNNLGKVSQDKGITLKALEYYQKSLDIKKELDDKEGMSHTYHNIALIHKAQNSYDLAMGYMQKAIEINEKLDEKGSISYLYSSLGDLYEIKQEYDTALTYYRKALKIREQLQDKSNIASSYQDFASVYLVLKKYEEAISFIKKSIDIRQKLGEQAHLAQSYLVLGSIKYQQGDYKEVIKYLNNAIELAQKAEDPVVIQESAGILALAHQKSGNYKEAYQNQLLLKQMTDSLSNDENTKRITRLESEYEFKQVEDSLQKTNILQANQLEKEEIKNRSQRNFNILISATLFIVLILAFFIYRSQQKQKNLNTQLNEQKEALSLRGKELVEVNNELSTLNEELNQTQEEIIAQRDSIESQNILLEEQHQEIKYSIRAAQTIQNAILPLEEQMKQKLNDYFLIYRPRDVVSGDFYWLGSIGKTRIIGALDCTGHGVQGAFMSMIGFTILNKIVNTNKITKPEQILERLRKEIQQALRQKQTNQNNGMDAVIVTLEELDNNQTQVTFAGAKRPLWYIKNQETEIKEVKGSRISIGINYKDDRKITSETLVLPSGSLLYFGSDGLVDQNNMKREKLGTTKLKELLSQNALLPLNEQKEAIENALDEHMKDTKQRDDILWMGIKV
ncbi:tetratricopeptide repeat protein [Bernardetia litoralis DSM 6794]|uniref:Tetratricopeptide repeat protein n=1 Tax=Bernardetia litoralis (strain ATCC 23117 / DSM 6794 / NBRC 15988 / NCIMB 1366 / Fx l1 / Sio-4) TaxID=880071 RepID=I4AGQ4_BERLS|nr:tetratricopeptide repeat protein [Bernardetia litoralis]AFM03139.1 tetratricopeptide repeat protein [Bernardetia litoralis DSM 6794]